MPRQKKGPRDLSPQPETGAKRIAAVATLRYRWDIDGPLHPAPLSQGELDFSKSHYVIVDQHTGDIIERCKTLAKSEVETRVLWLNSGVTLTVGDKRSLGILKKPGRISADSIPRIALPSPTQLVERLVSNPAIRAELHKYQTTQKALDRRALTQLLERALGADVYTSFCRLTTEKKERFVDSVSQQLLNKFGIQRPNRFLITQ